MIKLKDLLNEGFFVKTVVKDLQKMTRDKTIEFDGYDANNRPLFISTKNPDMEYTIDKKDNIWSHDGHRDKKIGKLKESENVNEQRPFFQDTPNEFAYLSFKKWAYGKRGMIKKVLQKALDDNRGDGTYLYLALRKIWLEWANKKAKEWSRIPNHGPDGKDFGRALAVMMKKDNLIIPRSTHKLTDLK